MRFFAKSCLFALLIASASADDCCSCAPFDGFYAGVSGGASANHADMRTKSSADYDVQGLSRTLNLNLKSYHDAFENRGWGEIFAGFGRQCGCYYMGGRAGINFSGFSPDAKAQAENIIPLSETESQSSKLVNKVKTEMCTIEYTLDFKPGFVVSPKTMFFGIIGAAFNEKELKGSSKFVYENGIIVGDAPPVTIDDAESVLKAHKTVSTTGFRAGLGLEHLISPCMSLQVNYVYTSYHSAKKKKEGEYTTNITIDQTVVPTTFPHTASFKTEAHKHIFSTGIAYYF